MGINALPLQCWFREDVCRDYLSLVIRFGFYSTPETLDKLIESGKVAQPPEEVSQLEDHTASLSTTTSMEWGESSPPEESQTTTHMQGSETTHHVTEVSTSSARSTQAGNLLAVVVAIAMVVLLIVLAARAGK